MNPNKLKRTLYVSMCLAILIACSDNHKRKPENSQDAIILAEEFIKNNGYTTLKADKKKFEFESSDDLIRQDIPATLKKRYNTLQPKAFCILEDKYGWHVGFLKPGIDVNKFDSLKTLPNPPGRIVNIYTSGETRMSPKDPQFSNFIPLK
jgi:hypothetical protein